MQKIHVVYPASIHWDKCRQRPHHIFSNLAKRGLIVHFCAYVDYPVPDNRKIEEVEPNFFLYLDNDFMMEEVFKLSGQKVLLASWPGAWEKNWKKPWSLRAYDYLDDFHIGDESERKCLREADVVFTSGEFLHKKALQVRSQVILAPNGCDFEMFKRAQKREPVPEIESLPHPILGYFGSLSSWFDSAMVSSVANQWGFGSIVLIGTIHEGFSMPSRTRDSKPVIVNLGPKPYEDLWKYLSNFDACIIPFRQDRDFIQAVNPIKIYEYMASGKPVISTAMADIEKFSPAVKICNDPEAFLRACAQVVREPDGMDAQRIKFAEENDWKRTGEEFYLGILDGLGLSRYQVKHKTPHILPPPEGKIALIVPNFLDKNGKIGVYGGAERHYGEAIKILERFGEVVIFQTGENTLSATDAMQEFKHGKNSVRIIPKGMDIADYFRRQKDRFRAFVYSSLHVSNGPMMHPNVVIYHGFTGDNSPFSGSTDRVEFIKNSYLRRDVDYVIANDSTFVSVLRMLSKDRQEHWDLVYNFVDTEHFTPKKEAKKKKGKEMTILYPRFFNTSRGIDIAVKTAEAVCGRNKNIKFIFSGCHYDWEPHFASVLELQKKFPGQVEITTTDFEGMKVLYDRSDVVIIPTHCSEGSSLSCLEALSMGKIVLTSWAGGLPDIMLNRYNGFILPDRAESFIEKIEEVYEIKDTATITKMRQNARETAMAFDIEHWREHWYKTMKRMLGV